MRKFGSVLQTKDCVDVRKALRGQTKNVEHGRFSSFVPIVHVVWITRLEEVSAGSISPGYLLVIREKFVRTFNVGEHRIA